MNNQSQSVNSQTDDRPLISVVVPVYNTERLLLKCIDSIRNQTYKNLEIIIINDGSSDSCPELCNEFAKKDSRIKVIHQQNQGPAATIQNGISAATGKYTGFVDSDDYINADMFEKLSLAAVENDACLVQCGYYESFDDGRLCEKKFVSRKEVYNNKESIVSLTLQLLTAFEYKQSKLLNSRWTKLIRTELLKNNLCFCRSDIKIGDDLNLIFPVLLSSSKIVLIQDCLYYYYQNSQSMTKNYMRTLDYDYKHLIEVIREISIKKGVFDNLELAIGKRDYAYKLSCIKNVCLSNLKYKEKKLRIKQIHKTIVKTKIKQANFMQRLKQRVLEILLFFKGYGLIALLIR